MTLFKRAILSLLYVVIFSVLLLSSCVGPGLAFRNSPYWFLQQVTSDEVTDRNFHVAILVHKEGGDPELDVVRASVNLKTRYPSASYHLEAGHHKFYWPDEGGATVDVEGLPHESQTVRVFVTGDTPWTSLSEYRVENNEVIPLRYADSVGWFLLLSFILPFVVVAFSGRLRRKFNVISGI